MLVGQINIHIILALLQHSIITFYPDLPWQPRELQSLVAFFTITILSSFFTIVAS